MSKSKFKDGMRTNSSYHTKQDIALCFGERTGYDVEPKDIRVRGNWLFHRADWLDGDVDCYPAKDARYNSGVLCPHGTLEWSKDGGFSFYSKE